jgi:hypothetical protein
VFRLLISIFFRCGAVAQLGERTAGSRKVRGSIPLSSTIRLMIPGAHIQKHSLCYHKEYHKKVSLEFVKLSSHNLYTILQTATPAPRNILTIKRATDIYLCSLMVRFFLGPQSLAGHQRYPSGHCSRHNVMILLHGFIKKFQKIPKNELKTTLSRLKEYQED